MNILFFGDIVGQIGIDAVTLSLPKLAKAYDIDFTIANGENASRGKGLTEVDYRKILEAGVDVITLGNHWRSKQQIDDYIDDADSLIRPLNVLNYEKGSGSSLFDCDGVSIRVTNVLGQSFLKDDVGAPYDALTQLLASCGDEIHIVDFHAESTSEKALLGYAMDGKVSALVCTHTHVQTADEKILPNGTAFISDIGMCGAANGIIGVERQSALDKILYGHSEVNFGIDERDDKMVNAIVLEIDEISHKAVSIKRVYLINGVSK